MTTTSIMRNNIFISYSHKDAKFAERLKVHLAASIQKAAVVYWTDAQIKPGSDWREAIELSLASAKIAILLVSADYLASKFVIENELSSLLARAQREEAIVIPVILSPCAFGLTDLAQFQAINPSSRPLTKMSKFEQEELWVDLTKLVSSALSAQQPSHSLTSPKENTLLTYRGHSREVRSVAWSPDGRLIASGSADNTVQVWEVDSGKRFLTYSGHTDWVRSVAWSPDGKLIASGSVDQTVQIWDAVSGNKLVTYFGHPDVVRSVVWSPDGQLIASGGNDQSTQIWEAASGKPLFTYQHPNDEVTDIAWSPNGQSIASAGNDGTVHVWNVAKRNNIFIYRGHSNGVNSVAWSTNGQFIASASNDKTVQVWQVR